MIRSFRLKIGLLSVILSGAILFAFGTFFHSVIRRMALDRVDRELRMLCLAQIRRNAPPEHWSRLDHAMSSVYGEEGGRPFIVRVTDPGGAPLFTSPNWPALAEDQLPALAPAPASEAPPDQPPPRFPGGFGKRRRLRQGWDSPPAGHPRHRMSIRGPSFATAVVEGVPWRLARVANQNLSLTIGRSLEPVQREISRFRRMFLAASGLALLLLAAGGWVLAQQALRPVESVTRLAESMTARRLDQRIPDTNADREFQRLIVVMNGMLDRLERSFTQAIRFSADAAHELKTPLTVLQAQIEQAVQQAEDASPAQREYAGLLEEVQRLKHIVRKLLLLSQADAGQLPLSPERMDLSEQIHAAFGELNALAPDRRIRLDLPAGQFINGDRELVSRMLENLASNALKFSEPGGSILATVRAESGQAVFTVANTGRPIPAEDHDKVFERFYRADKSRGRRVDGTGLGLSLAREIARAHHGDLRLAKSDDESTEFVLTLPLTSP